MTLLGHGDVGGEELEDFLGFWAMNLCVCSLWIWICSQSVSTFLFPYAALPQILHVLPAMPPHIPHIFSSYILSHMVLVKCSLYLFLFIVMRLFLKSFFCFGLVPNFANMVPKCERFVHLQCSFFFFFLKKNPQISFWEKFSPHFNSDFSLVAF